MTNVQAGRGCVVVAECNPSGHRLVYVRVLVERALGDGRPAVILLTPECDGPELELHLGALASRATFDLGWDGNLSGLEAAALHHNAELIIVPHGEILLRSTAIRGWAGTARLRLLIMRDPRGEALSPRRWARGRAKLAGMLLAKRRENVDVVVLAQAGDADRRFGFSRVVDPFIGLADRSQIEAAAEARRSGLGLSDGLLIAVVGALSRRKNVPLIVAAVAQASSQIPNRVHLLVAGPIGSDVDWSSEDLRNMWRGTSARLHLDLRLHTNDELNAVISAADVVVTAYSIPYPNSTLIKAQALGSKAVVAGSKFVRSRAKRLPGVATSPLNAAALAAAIMKVVDEEPPPATVAYDQEVFARRMLAAGES